MEVSQVYQFVNSAALEAIGESAVLAEDLSNVVDMGAAIFNGEAFDPMSLTWVLQSSMERLSTSMLSLL